MIDDFWTLEDRTMTAPQPSCPNCHAVLSDDSSAGSCPACGALLDETAQQAGPTLSSQRRAGGGLRPWLVGTAAIVVAFFAGWTLYKNSIRSEQPMVVDSGPPLPLPDWSSISSHLQLFRHSAGADRPVVFLQQAHKGRHPSLDAQPQIVPRGILARELVNQAFLIAARDGLGLATRDELLGESAPAGAPDATVGVLTTCASDRDAPVPAALAKNSKHETIWLQAFPLLDDNSIDYPRLVDELEELSRGKVLATLKQSGFEGRPNAVRAEAPAPEATEKRLAGMSFATQLAAVRELHTAIRADGESPQRLGALVRGYANLGILTEYQWTPAHKVFKARALLYAQRMAAADRKSAWALWHRAYACALAGLHADASADLEAAKTLSKTTPAPPPEWVDLIDAYCQCDVERLAAAQVSHTALAGLLHFLAAEDYSFAPSQTLAAAGRMVEADPECCRAIDAMCQVGGVSNLHAATMAGLQVLDQAIPQRLLSLPDLPKEVEAAIKQERGEPALVKALFKAGAPGSDSREPSWSALGRMVREARFVAVWRRIDFMRNMWSVPVDDFLDESLPLVADHPYRRFIESFAAPNPGQGPGELATLHALDLRNVEMTAFPLAMQFNGNQYEYGNVINYEHQNEDGVFRDQALRFARINNSPATTRRILNRLAVISPYAPLPVAWAVERDWELAKPHVAEWEKSFRQSPAVLSALGKRYTELQQWDDAERCLKQYIGLSPDVVGFRLLADVYKSQGKLDRWKETLDEFLKHEDYGLAHATARVEIANYLMRQGKDKDALPYAEAAAETWAAWAMLSASVCNERLENWERSEMWVSRTSERYDNQALDWLNWCMRTGRGDARQAAQLAMPSLEALGDRIEGEELSTMILCALLLHEPRKVLVPIQKTYPRPDSLHRGLYLALLADEAKDTELRDKTLEHFVSKDENVVKLAALFRESLAG